MSLWVKIFLGIFVIIVMGLGAIVYKGLSFERNIAIPSKQTSFLKQIQKLVTKNDDEKQNQPDEINILLLGLPGKGHDGSELTDTIILLMIRPKEHKAAMLSIPRDLYIKIPDLNIGYSRINTVYTYGNEYKHEQGGVGLLKKTVKDLTGVTVDNYVFIDFDGFVKLIDILGGVEIDNKEDIYDTAYPGPKFTYRTFKLKKGQYTLNGETALKYVRTRHSTEGDFGRAKRQQTVLNVIKDKILELNPIFDLGKINEIINTLGEHIKTDVPIEQMKLLYEIYKGNFQVVSEVIDASPETGVLVESKEPLGTGIADVLKPRLGEGNYSEIHEIVDNIFDLEMWKNKRKQLAQEKASVEIKYSSQDFESKTISDLTNELIKFGYQATAKQIKTSELPETSIIYDLTLGTKPASLEDLKNKLDAKTSVPIADIKSDSNFVAIIKNSN